MSHGSAAARAAEREIKRGFELDRPWHTSRVIFVVLVSASSIVVHDALPTARTQSCAIAPVASCAVDGPRYSGIFA